MLKRAPHFSLLGSLPWYLNRAAVVQGANVGNLNKHGKKGRKERKCCRVCVTEKRRDKESLDGSGQ